MNEEEIRVYQERIQLRNAALEAVHKLNAHNTKYFPNKHRPVVLATKTIKYGTLVEYKWKGMDSQETNKTVDPKELWYG